MSIMARRCGENPSHHVIVLPRNPSTPFQFAFFLRPLQVTEILINGVVPSPASTLAAAAARLGRAMTARDWGGQASPFFTNNTSVMYSYDSDVTHARTCAPLSFRGTTKTREVPCRPVFNYNSVDFLCGRARAKEEHVRRCYSPILKPLNGKHCTNNQRNECAKQTGSPFPFSTLDFPHQGKQVREPLSSSPPILSMPPLLQTPPRHPGSYGRQCWTGSRVGDGAGGDDHASLVRGLSTGCLPSSTSSAR